MNSGEIIAHHYATRRPVRLSWRDGLITDITEVAEKSAKNLWLAPPLMDLQINGYAGVDFQRDDLTEEKLLHAARGLRRDGCARFFFTLITDEWPRLMNRLERACRLRAQSPELMEAIAGWHIEGPFLSQQPGFCGAHNPAWMCDPTPEHLRTLRAVAGNDPVLITVAPERVGAVEAIRLARQLGMTVSLGHTNATADVLREAVKAGATAFTHLANGCPRELDRHDNIVWRVADEPGLGASFIPDGIHVSPAPFRALHRLLGNDRLIYYTTDAMAAGGAAPGRYTLGNVEVEVGADQIVRQPGKTNFAGSALRPIDGVFRAAEMLRTPWQECWWRFSETPAQFVGLRNQLGVGEPAVFCAIAWGEGNRVLSLQTNAGNR